MVKILAIGDPHGNLKKIKNISFRSTGLVLLTGDLGKADLARKRFFENKKREKEGLPKLEKDAKFLESVHKEIHDSTISLLRYLSKQAPIYFIQGNVGIPSISEVKEGKKKHGLRLPNTRKDIEKTEGLYLVKNRLRVLKGLRVGFLEYFTDTSWVREFRPPKFTEEMKKAKKETDKARKILRRFGSKLDILVCHQPPFGILDKVNFPGAPKHWQGKHAGSKVILDYIKKYQPKYVLCGHIHEGKGHKKIGKTNVYNLGVAGHVSLEL